MSIWDLWQCRSLQYPHFLSWWLVWLPVWFEIPGCVVIISSHRNKLQYLVSHVLLLGFSCSLSAASICRGTNFGVTFRSFHLGPNRIRVMPGRLTLGPRLAILGAFNVAVYFAYITVIEVGSPRTCGKCLHKKVERRWKEVVRLCAKFVCAYPLDMRRGQQIPHRMHVRNEWAERVWSWTNQSSQCCNNRECIMNYWQLRNVVSPLSLFCILPLITPMMSQHTQLDNSV